ncbi:MAG TPA: porin family protein [Aliiroseovarius sp.]|nr:porin family protein [Aliiroseovarius sp.]
MRTTIQVSLIAMLAAGTAANAAELEISLYAGAQEAAHSQIVGNDPGGAGAFDLVAGWEGKSFAMPPYWGARATWWTSDTWGFGVELTHAKVYADDATRLASGFSRLEFTDGLNIITVNAFRAFPMSGPITPYVGAGVGLSIPHVDISSAGGTTFGYQMAGPAVTWMAGASYAINDRWSVFAEYKGSYTINSVTLGSGGTLDTNIVTSAIDVGVSLKF